MCPLRAGRRKEPISCECFVRQVESPGLPGCTGYPIRPRTDSAHPGIALHVYDRLSHSAAAPVITTTVRRRYRNRLGTRLQRPHRRLPTGLLNGLLNDHWAAGGVLIRNYEEGPWFSSLSNGTGSRKSPLWSALVGQYNCRQREAARPLRAITLWGKRKRLLDTVWSPKLRS